MGERTERRTVGLAGIVVLGLLVFGVGAALGAGGESTTAHDGTGNLGLSEWDENINQGIAPSEPGESGGGADENPVDANDTQEEFPRESDNDESSRGATKVSLDEVSTLDEPGIYQTNVSDFEYVKLILEGAGGGASRTESTSSLEKDGGAGGLVEAILDVTFVDTLEIDVAEGGESGDHTDCSFPTSDGGSGFPDGDIDSGGDGGCIDEVSSGGGGGGSGVTAGDGTILAVAGGGGGAGGVENDGGEDDGASGGGGGPDGPAGSTCGGCSIEDTVKGSDGANSSLNKTYGGGGGVGNPATGVNEATDGFDGGYYTNSDYLDTILNGTVGGGASGATDYTEKGNDGTVTVITPNISLKSVDGPDTVQSGENLTVDYTLENSGGVKGEESFVDLDINGTLEEFDSGVTVPAGGTTSGSLTFTNTDAYDAVEWCIELFDYGDQTCGTTSVPNISIQSVTGPSEIAPGEDLTVDYTLENDGGGGEETFVDLYVNGSLETFDSNVFVPGGGTTSGSLTFGDTGSYSNGDTIPWSVELFDFGDSADGVTDVVVEPDISIQSVSAPDEIGIDETLFVDYTLQNNGGDGTESSVDLLVEGLTEDSDSDVFVPGGGTTSGTLVYDSVQSDFDYGETIQWTVELADAGDTASGSTDIEPAPPEFRVSIQSTNSPVTVGQTLSVETRIENIGGRSDTQTVELRVTGVGTDSTSVTLSGGSSTTETFTVATSGDDSGDYTAEVSTANDTATTSVTLLDPPSFDVTITGTNDPVEGEPLDVTAEITNTGGVEATQTIDLTVSGLGSDSTDVTLGAGNSTTETLSVATASGDAGDYTAEVASENTTDTASVTVLQEVEFDVLIVGKNESAEGNPVQVDAQISNSGDIEATQTVTLDVPGLGSNSTDVTLGGGDATIETFTVDTSSGDAGEYTAEVSSADDSDTVGLTVLEAAQFGVTITGTNEPLEGESLDVTAEITNTGEVEDTQTVTLDVPGLGSDSTDVTLSGGVSKTEIFTVTTSSGDAGEYTAEVASDDDIDTANVTVLSEAEFEVNVTSSGDSVEGDPLAIDAEITNAGDLEDSQNVTLDVPGLGTAFSNVTLSGGSSTVETFQIATSVGDAGEYTATVSSDDDTDTASVTVLEQPEFAVTITGTNEPLEGDTLDVTAEITNTGGVEATQSIGLDVSELGSTATDVTLGGGNSTTLTLSVGTGGGDAGEYTAQVSSDDDSDTANVTVLADATFSVAITNVTEPVEGDDLAVTTEITNTGDVEGTGTIDLDVGALGTNATDVTLGPGNSTVETLTVGTTSGDAGTYTATVTSDDDTDSTEVSVLAEAGFTVAIVNTGDPVEGDPLAVDVSVENVGDVEETQTVSLDAGALGTDSTDVTLSGGNSTVETLSVATAVGDAGTYTVTVTSEDDTDSTTAQVLQKATFNVSITGTGEPVEGTALDVEVTVENTGDIEGTQAVALDVGALGTDDTAVTLGPGNSTVETLTVGTQMGDAGTYTATVTSDDDSASTDVTVLAAPEFSVDITGTSVSGSVLDVNYEVENVGDVEDTQTLTFSVDSTTEAQREHTLGGGESTQESFAYDIVAGDAPDLAVEVASADDSATRTVSIAPANLSLSVLDVGPAVAASVVEGENLSVTVEATNTGDEPLSETVELLDIDGALADTQSVDLVGGETTQATLVWATEPGDAGTGNVTVDSETAEAQTRAVEVLAPPEVTVEILDAATPVEGDDLTVTVGVENVGDIEDTQTIGLDVGALGTDSTQVTLPGGESTQETLSVGTSVGEAGEYTATVTSENDSASQEVMVLQEAAFAVSITGTSDPVAGENLTVTAEITNTGETEDTQTVELDVPGLGSDGTTLTLPAGESSERTFSVATTAGDAGDYNATVASEDSQDSASVTVLEPASFAVTIVGDVEVVAGADLVVTAAVENTGDVEATGTVTLAVGDLGDNSTAVTLGPGASAEIPLSVATEPGDAGTYTATVTSPDDEDTAQVVVLEPPSFDVTIADTSDPVAGGTLVVTAEITNLGEVGDSQTVTLDVPGLGSDQTDVVLDPGNATQETFTVGTGEGDAGSYTATVASADDEDSQNVTVLAQANMAVEIVETGDPVAGEDLTVTVNVTNTGDVEGTQPVELDVPGLGSDDTAVTLAGGASVEKTLSVATGPGDAGSYTAEVSTDDDTDSAAVTVLQQAAFMVTITGTSDPVAGETLSVTAQVTNTGESEDTQTVELDVPGLGTDSTEVTLGGGSSTVETLAVATDPGDAGTYTATLSSDDDEDSQNVTVLQEGAFAVAITETSEPVAGETLTVTASIENTGDVETAQTVELDVPGLGTNTTELTLAGGESVEETLSVATDPGDAGNYTATVTTADDSASAAVTVLEGAAFAVSIAGTGTPVEGELLTVTAAIENTGDVEDTGAVTLDVPGLGTNTTELTLAGGESVEEQLAVATRAGDAGTYTATVTSPDDSASTNVTVLAAANFSVSIAGANEPVAGETLSVTAAIENTGDIEGTGTVELDVGTLGSDETTLTLSGGESVEETLSVATEAGDAGTYTAEVTSPDDSASTAVTVLQEASFAVSIDTTGQPVAGENLTVTAAIENTGDIEATQTITLDVPGLGTDTTGVTLGGDASTVETLAVATGPGDAGEYTATVSSADDSDSTGVTVLEPATFAVTVTNTSEPVAGQELAVTAEITNAGEAAATQTVTLDVGPLGTNSTEVELDGGASTETTLTVDTGTDQAGEYTATVASADDSDETTVTVLQADEFAVDIVELDETVIEGTSMSMTVEVTNVGQGPGTQLLTVDVEGHDSVEMSVDLGAGETRQETMEMSMEPQKLGTFNVTVATADDTDEDAIEVRLPVLPGQEGPPGDTLGDGYYEDVDGDGTFDIFDVQTFFNHFESPAVQEHGWAYDFTDDGAVTVFDVQAMFNRI